LNGGNTCGSCGVSLAPSLLVCWSCHALVHADRLKVLVREAEGAERQGDAALALSRWREALVLVPDTVRQHTLVLANVQRLSATQTAAVPRSTFAAKAGAAGTAALLLWKLKFVFVALLSKGKLLLMGLTKASTFFSMAASLGAYWTLWGWRYAVGVVGMIYIHEMGHVWALRQIGVAASAPVFVPGVGAFVRLQQGLANASENARVGLAGPIWGAAAAALACAVGFTTHSAFLLAMAKTAGWINLFNLLPIWQLDGGRAFTALGRNARMLAAAVLCTLAWASGESFLWILGGASLIRVVDAPSPESSDARTLPEFLAVATVLAGVLAIAAAAPSLQNLR